MRNFLKYLLIIIAACAIVFLLFSCSAKKKVTAAAAPDGEVDNDELRELRFGAHFVDGCAQRMKGNLQEALKQFDECLKIRPEDPALNYELGTIHKLLGDNDRALAHAKIASAANPANEWYQLLYIECLNSKGLYQQSIKVREQLVRQFPTRLDFREELAIGYAVIGQYEKSLKLYEELEKQVGVSEQLTLNKVRLLKNQRRFKEVEEEFKKLIESNPKEPNYYAHLAEFYMEREAPEKAKELYDQIVRIDSLNPTIHLALHDYYSLKGDHANAFSNLRKAFSNQLLDPSAKAGILANYYRQAETGDPTGRRDGTELADILVKTHPEIPASHALYGDFLMLDKKTSEAVTHYRFAALREGRDPRIWDNLLFAENEMAQFDSLEKHAAMATELFPSRTAGYLYLAIASSRNNKPKEAARALEDGMSFVTDQAGQKLDFLRLMGDVYHQLGVHEKSDEAFEEALKINTDDSYVLNNYAYYLAIRGKDLEKAARLSKKANDLETGNRNYMDTYGFILYKMQRYAESLEWFSAASAKGPANPTILEHYGDALYRSGKTDKAVEQWEAAKKAGGDSPELLRKLKDRKIAE